MDVEGWIWFPKRVAAATAPRLPASLGVAHSENGSFSEASLVRAHPKSKPETPTIGGGVTNTRTYATMYLSYDLSAQVSTQVPEPRL